MKEWIEYNFGWQDWAKFRRRFLTILLFPLVIYLLIQGYGFLQSLYYHSSTYATIIKVTPLATIRQSRYGSTSSMMGYRIAYVYRVNGILYEQESVKTGWWSHPDGKTATVWYHAANPEENILMLK